MCVLLAISLFFSCLPKAFQKSDVFSQDGNHHVRSFASRHVCCTCSCDLCCASSDLRSGSSSSDLRSASASDVCSTRGELHGACSQLHCTSTSGDVRCAAPSHVRGCCSRGDVRRASGQLRGSITDHRDLLSYVTFLLPQRQLTSLRGPTAFSHAHVRCAFGNNTQIWMHLLSRARVTDRFRVSASCLPTVMALHVALVSLRCFLAVSPQSARSGFWCRELS